MKIIIKNLQRRIPINRKETALVKKAVSLVLASEKRNSPGEISFCLVNNRMIRELNLMFLGRNTATDVIAFNLSAEKGRRKELFADIAISTDMAAVNSRAYKATPLRELLLYVIHGVLHVLGYDDATLRQRRLMQEKADRILDKIDAHS